MIKDAEDSTREKLGDNEGKLFKSKEVIDGANVIQMQVTSLQKLYV